MTDVATNPTVAADPHAAPGHHPTVKTFITTAAILAVVTAVEVAWSYLPVWDGATGVKSAIEIGGLALMMMFKFIVVAGTFMHLKFDRRILTRVFYAGFVLAVMVFLAVLTAFELWSSGKPGYAP